MKRRFEGEEGDRLLIEALLKQYLVEHNNALATMLAESGELVEFAPNTDIVVQNDVDKSIYFLVSGEANVFINDRFIGHQEHLCN
jgi:CRP-like cAMP-binding protein